MTTPSPAVIDFVRRVQQHVVVTDGLLASIRPDVPVAHPIPFFGPLVDADVLTVAMNPSADEFRARGWPMVMSAEALTTRLLTYFAGVHAPPHPWFEKAEVPLRPLGVRYGHALAHVDIVPRATKTIGREDGPAFLRLAEADAWVLFESLSLAENAGLLILTGSVTNQHYAHEWVARLAPSFGWSWRDKATRVPGGPFSAFHQLRRQGRTVVVFFTSASASRRGGPQTYYNLVGAHADRLRGLVQR